MAVSLRFTASGDDVLRFWKAIGDGAQRAGREVADTSRFWNELARAARRANREIEESARRPTASVRALNAGIREVRGSVEGLSSRLGPLGSALGALGTKGAAIGAAAVGVTALGVAYTVATKRALENASAIQDAADRAGVGTERYQELAFAAKQAGIEQNTLGSSLATFAGNVGKAAIGSGALATSLEKQDKALLANIQRAATTEEALDLVLAKLTSMTRETDRAALAQAAFGRAGKELLPLLKAGADGLAAQSEEARRLGLVIRSDLIANAEAADDALAKVADVVSANLTAALIQAAPAIEATAKGLANLIARINELVSGRERGVLSLTPKIDAINQALARTERDLDRTRGGPLEGENLDRVLNLQKERDALLATFQAERDVARQRTQAANSVRRAEADALQARLKAEEDAKRAAKAGASEAKRAAAERERILEQLANEEREAALAPLDGIAKVEKARDQAIAKFRDQVKDQKDAVELVARFEVSANAKAQAEIADIREKAADKAEKDAERVREQEKRALEKAVEEQQRVLEGIANDVSGLLASGLVEGFAAGKDAAFDWGEAVQGIIKRLAVDLTQALLVQGVIGPLLGVQPGAGGSSSTGAGLLSLLVGGGGGGSVVGAGTSLLSGGSTSGTGGLLGGLLRVGGSGSTGTPSTFGIPSLLKQALFGGSALAFAGPTLSGLNAAATAAPLGFTMPTTIGPAITGFQGGVGAGAGGAASGLSAGAAWAGLAIALGLGAKGISDTRGAFSSATLGAAGSNAAQNRLTAIQGITLAGATAAGAGIGAGVGTAAFPVIGTVIGAGVGAAVGAAVSDAVGQSVSGSISTGVQEGLSQAQLEKRIADDLTTNPLLLALGGLAHILASKVLGPAVAPNIENIFAKVFRGSIGGPGGLDTAGVTGVAPRRLDYLRGDAGTASRLIAQAFGAGGEAFGENRENRFLNILLGGINKRAKKTGDPDDRILAETFVGAWNGRFLDAMKSVLQSRKGLREGDAKFVADQFTKAQSGFGYQTLADIILEDERVPGKRARKASREAFREGVAASVQNPLDARAFQRSVTGSFIEVATGRVTDQLTKTFGQLLAPAFSLSREARMDLRRAKRRDEYGEVVDILSSELATNADQLAKIANHPELAAGIGRLADEMFRVGVAASEASKDFEAVRAQIEGKLAPFTAQVTAIDQLELDIRSRSRIALAGPGFGAAQAQIEEMERQRLDAERALRNSPITGGQFNWRTDDASDFDRLLGRGIVLPGKDEIDEFFRLASDYAAIRLPQLEAEISLQRQIVDLLEQATEALHGLRGQAQAVLGTFDSRAEAGRLFGRASADFATARAGGYQDPVSLQRFLGSLGSSIGATAGRVQFLGRASSSFSDLADQLALQRGGRREGRRQLNDLRSEIARLIPIASRDGEGSDDAISRLQGLFSKSLQLGQGTLTPGGLRRLQREIEGQARGLGVATGAAEDVARQQLSQLEKMAAAAEGGAGTALGDANLKLEELKGELRLFATASTVLLGQLSEAARDTLATKLEEIKGLLGEGGTASYLKTIKERYGLPAGATGAANVGNADGAAGAGFTNGFGSFPTPAPPLVAALQRFELAITVEHVGPGLSGPEAVAARGYRTSLNGRSLGKAEAQETFNLLRKLGVLKAA